MKIRARFKTEPFQPDNEEGILTYNQKECIWKMNGYTCSLYQVEILNTKEEIESMKMTNKDIYGYARILAYLDEEQAIKESENLIK